MISENNGSKYGNISNFADAIEDIRKNIDHSASKLLAFTLHSPISNKSKWSPTPSPINSFLGTIQKHERTASFLNKLPTGLKEVLDSQAKMDTSIAANYLSLDLNNSNNSNQNEEEQSKEQPSNSDKVIQMEKLKTLESESINSDQKNSNKLKNSEHHFICRLLLYHLGLQKCQNQAATAEKNPKVTWLLIFLEISKENQSLLERTIQNTEGIGRN